MKQRRKIIVIFLLILTVILAGVSIYLTSVVQQNQQIVATHASTASDGCDCSLTGCGNGCWQWNCNNNCNVNANNFAVYLWTCNNSLANNAQCGGCGQTNGGTNTQIRHDRSGQFTVNQCGASQVDIGYDKAAGGIITGACFSFANSCGGNPPPPNPQPPPPNPQPPPPPPQQASCAGGTCSQDSDCKAPANGGTAVCRSGKCENRDCPAGKTIPGANCDCSVAGRICGQTCGASVGLCATGICAFLTRSCSGNEYSSPPTMCVPGDIYGGGRAAQGWTSGPGQCGGNTWVQYQGRNPSAAEIQAACAPKYKCSGSSCVEDDANGTFTDNTCGNSCTPPSVGCGQACGPSANNATCTSGLSCQASAANPSSFKCILQSNPNSATCQPATNVGCNQACDNAANNGAGNCNPGLYCCSNCDSAGPRCRLPASPFSTVCTSQTTVTCGQACDGINTVCDGTHVCSGGVCKLNQCVNTPSSCLPDACTPVTQVACGASCDSTHVCASGQACNAGTCKTNSCIATPSSCTPNGCQTLNTVACGQACDSTNVCDTANGYTCNAGTCKMNQCISTPSSCTVDGCTPITTVSCGQACDASHACDSTHTCSGGVCKLNACVSNPSSCTSDSCNLLSVCGGNCTTSNDCSTNHACVSGKCVLNGCTSSTCNNGCTPLCGGPCATNNDCPTNHTCQAGKCILNGCTASTCVNGCTLIPNTGILDDARLLLIGLVFITAGYLSYKFKFGRNLSLSLLDNDELFREKLEKDIEEKIGKED